MEYNNNMREDNEQSAQAGMQMLGYAPNPHCEHCGGFGRVHPMKFDGKTDYGQSVMCLAKGCLRDSYNNRILK